MWLLMLGLKWSHVSKMVYVISNATYNTGRLASKYFFAFPLQASEIEVLWAMRIGVILVGALATVVAIHVDSIYGLWSLCSDLVYVILFPQLLCAVHFKNSNVYGSITGLVMGLIFRLTGGEPLLGLPPAIKYPWWYEDDGVIYQNFPFKTLAMLISLICIVSVSLITHACFTNGILSEDMDVLSGVVRRRWVSQSNGNLRESNGNISADEGVENPVFVTRL